MATQAWKGKEGKRAKYVMKVTSLPKAKCFGKRVDSMIERV